MESEESGSCASEERVSHPITSSQLSVIHNEGNGETQQEHMKLWMENLDKETQILHNTIDQCVGEVVAASKSWLDKAQNERSVIYEVNNNIKKLVELMTENCSGISLRMQQCINSLGGGIQQESPDLSHNTAEDKRVVKSHFKAAGSKNKKPRGKQHLNRTARKLTPKRRESQKVMEARQPAQESKIFKCEVCEKEFRSKASQKAHARYHSYDLKYKCADCGRGYPIKSYLERHMMTHTGERPHKCDICNKGFHANSMLQEHKKTHLPDQPIYKCDLCERTYTRKRSLILHQWMHREDNPYKCHICAHAFTGWNSVYEHIKTHTGEKPFKCEVCEKTFVRKTHLTKHMEVHMEVKEKPHKCKECGKGFISIYALNVHMVTHNPETPYLCDFCGKGFKYQVSLRHHKNLHATSRPLVRCDICGNHYKSENYLKAHKRIHLKDKTYKCDICGNCFREKLQLSYHKWVHKDERPHKCHICQKSFVLQSQLKKHLEIHRTDRPFSCDICEKNFKSKYEVNIHKKKVHERKRKIQLESKSITLPQQTSSQVRPPTEYNQSSYRQVTNALLSRHETRLQQTEPKHDVIDPVRPGNWTF